jgi:hypothetical protein
MEQQHDLLANELTVNGITRENFLSSAKWGKFLSIVGFVFCGLMAIMAFFLSAYMSNTYQSSGMRINPIVFTLIYLMLAVILFFPCLYLYKYSTQMIEAISNTRQDNFDSSVMNLKSLFKFYGIFTIVMLSFYALAIVGGIIAAMTINKH